jgi:hypothetical protein
MSMPPALGRQSNRTARGRSRPAPVKARCDGRRAPAIASGVMPELSDLALVRPGAGESTSYDEPIRVRDRAHTLLAPETLDEADAYAAAGLPHVHRGFPVAHRST